MKTIIKKTSVDNIDMDTINQAGEIIRQGGLVAFPTETVYGLGADALNEEAAAKIYAAKGRPSDNPLIAHIADLEMLKPLVEEIPPVAEKLMDAFWPGPLTIIMKKSPLVPMQTTGGLDTVAVRMPSDSTARAIINAAGVPLAAPSANLSGLPSPTSFPHVCDDLMGRVDGIVNGGDCEVGVESTVITVVTARAAPGRRFRGAAAPRARQGRRGPRRAGKARGKRQGRLARHEIQALRAESGRLHGGRFRRRLRRVFAYAPRSSCTLL